MNATIQYKVTLNVQLNFSENKPENERPQALIDTGRMFLQSAIMGQDLNEKQDADGMRKQLGLEPTLVPHVKPIVEAISDSQTLGAETSAGGSGTNKITQ